MKIIINFLLILKFQKSNSNISSIEKKFLLFNIFVYGIPNEYIYTFSTDLSHCIASASFEYVEPLDIFSELKLVSQLSSASYRRLAHTHTHTDKCVCV